LLFLVLSITFFPPNGACETEVKMSFEISSTYVEQHVNAAAACGKGQQMISGLGLE
jgi:hypothetical protein